MSVRFLISVKFLVRVKVRVRVSKAGEHRAAAMLDAAAEARLIHLVAARAHEARVVQHIARLGRGRVRERERVRVRVKVRVRVRVRGRGRGRGMTLGGKSFCTRLMSAL